MEMKITSLDQSPFSYEDVVNLLHTSFEERLHQGFCFTCSTITVSQFKEKTSKSMILVAWQKQVLYGMVTLTLGTDSSGVIFGYHENLAINPSAKRLGIGTKLQAKCVEMVLDAGGEYEISDTAVGANSSVKWHSKNGFKKIGLHSYSSTNYYSYIFRKQLVPSRKWDNNCYVGLRFFLSISKTLLTYKKNGEPTILKKIFMKSNYK